MEKSRLNSHYSIVTVLAIMPALIMLQTLYFKFTGSPESIRIFTILHSEPWGRYLVGACELLASTLLLVPRTRTFGAIIGAGLMVGAIMSHVFVLGIESNNDGGLLFALASSAFICCTLVVVNDLETVRNLVKNLIQLLKRIVKRIISL